MVDSLDPEDSGPKPISSCLHCGATGFVRGRRAGLTQEIFCRECNAGYRVNVLHDGLFLVERIHTRPGRAAQHRLGHRRRRTDA
jgi:hypothetical protein